MELEQLLQLIDAVSESKLTDFRYEENGVKLCLKKEAAAVQTANAGGIPAGAGAPGAVQTFAGAAGAPGAVQMTAGAAGVPGAAQMIAGAAGVPGAVQAVPGAAAVGTVQAVSGLPAAVQSAEAAVTVQATAGASVSAGGKIVKSPLVGVFYAAPSEDKEPYVSVGDTVKKGQILACVEAMKLMNEIESDYDGVVEEILVENGQGVGYGEPLFVIR